MKMHWSGCIESPGPPPSSPQEQICARCNLLKLAVRHYSISQFCGPLPGAVALGMSELTVGQRVKVRPKVGPPQEGVVYTHDSITNTITIKEDIPNTKTHGTVIIYNRSHVEIEVVPGGGVADEFVALPHISDRELERKEEKAIAEATKAWAQINCGASHEGQAIFDLFSKTLECKWHGDSIEVVKSVRIDPPYTAKECQSLTGDKMGMDRIILMLGAFHKQLKQEVHHSGS